MFGSAVKMPVGMFTSYIRIPGFESQLCLQLQLAANLLPGEQWVTAQAVVCMPRTWETQIIECLAPACGGLGQCQLLEGFIE